MAIQNLGLIFVAGLDLGVALLIWLKNPRNRINIWLAISILFLGIWTLAVGMFKEAGTIDGAWFWTIVQNGSGAIMVVPFFIFSVYFPYQHFYFKAWHKWLMVFSLIIMLVIVCTPGAWTQKIILNPHDNDYETNRWGLGYFGLHFYFYIIFAYVNLIKKYLKSFGVIRDQLKYIIVGTGIISFFGSIFGIVIPLYLAGLGPHWIGPYFAVFMIIVLIYFGFFWRAKG